MRLCHPLERFQIMGFSQVAFKLPRLYFDLRHLSKTIAQQNPQGVILIDFPDFTMHLAAHLRKRGYKGTIIHYVCPSVWAWRKNRAKKLAQTVDHLLSILPFEQKYFANLPLAVSYVGHPLTSLIASHNYDLSHIFPENLIALFPGSRPHEIKNNLPLQLEAAKKLGGLSPYQLQGLLYCLSSKTLLPPSNSSQPTGAMS